MTLVKTIYYHGVEDFVNHERNILSVTLQIAFFIAYSFKVYAWIQEFVWTNHCNTASRPHLHKSSLEDAVLLDFFFENTIKVSWFLRSSIDLAFDSSDFTFRSLFCGCYCRLVSAFFLILYNQSNFGAIANIFFVFSRFALTLDDARAQNWISVSMLKCISLIGLMIHAFAFGLAQENFRNFF